MAQYVKEQFGDYRLIKYLGGGGFADVYLGEHIYLSTKEHPIEAAIKVLKGPFIAKEIAEFRNEAQTILRLEHPHIVRLITFSVAKIQGQEVPFLVMPYAPYGSLDKRHPRGTKVPLLTIISYIKQIAEALQYAHDQKVVHRDIKPANFLLAENEKVLLSDFGIAVTAHRTTSWVKQNVAGTEAYMAPEQFYAEARVESDQYSLGVVVYQWLCGELPFTKGNMGYQHNFVSPPLLHEKIPIHPAVEDVILKVLAKDPKERYPSIINFADALEQALQQAQISLSTGGTYRQMWRTPDHPGYIIFLLDQSGPMANGFALGPGRPICEAVATVLNSSLNALISRNTRFQRDGTPKVRPLVEVTVLGYGNGEVSSLLSYISVEKEVFTLPEVQARPLQIESRKRKEVDDMGEEIVVEVPFPVWIQPKGTGNAPMCMALQRAKALAEQWVSNHSESYPPVVIHVTLGVASDGDPLLPALQLRMVSTADGQTLLYNTLISKKSDIPVMYPSNEDDLPNDRSAKKLFAMSSPVPLTNLPLLESMLGRNIPAGARGYSFNGDIALEALISILVFSELDFPAIQPLDPNI